MENKSYLEIRLISILYSIVVYVGCALCDIKSLLLAYKNITLKFESSSRLSEFFNKKKLTAAIHMSP